MELVSSTIKHVSNSSNTLRFSMQLSITVNKIIGLVTMGVLSKISLATERPRPLEDIP